MSERTPTGQFLPGNKVQPALSEHHTTRDNSRMPVVPRNSCGPRAEHGVAAAMGDARRQQQLAPERLAERLHAAHLRAAAASLPQPRYHRVSARHAILAASHHRE